MGFKRADLLLSVLGIGIKRGLRSVIDFGLGTGIKRESLLLSLKAVADASFFLSLKASAVAFLLAIWAISSSEIVPGGVNFSLCIGLRSVALPCDGL